MPELVFEAAPAKPRDTKGWVHHTAHSMAKAEHLNGRKRDGYTRALIRERDDLAGLPFLLGDDCRKSDRGKGFTAMAGVIRSANPNRKKDIGDLKDLPAIFLTGGIYREFGELEFGERYEEAIAPLAAQILGGEPQLGRRLMVGLLGALSRPDATQQLARVAVFDPDNQVRKVALEALAVRRERDYSAVLVEALRYPWPAVAERAAEAIVKLERKDLLPELVDLLDKPDPRLPQTEKVEDKQVSFTRELVRVNHHKSCLLCHAPADPEKTLTDVLTAEIPVPSEPLPSPAQYYKDHIRNLRVRIDVTYLRQDFSALQPVKDADPWPEMQRFDFLVRKRVLSDAEAGDLRTRLTKKEPGELSPYHRAAVRALRDLTGRDLEAKAEPWRKLLKLPAKKDS